MEIKGLNISAFKELIKREEALRDGSPEHTLDWYTYNNRVALLNEVEGLLMPDVKLPKEVNHTVEKPEAPKTQVLKEGENPKKKKAVKVVDTKPTDADEEGK